MKKFSFIAVLPVLGLVGLCAFPLLFFAGLTGSSPASASAAVGVGVPGPYREIVALAGSICPEISPALIAAQVEAESGWRVDAVSKAGARGISQFMPATWDGGAGLDGDGDGVADIDNPIDAIWSQGNLMCAHVQAVRGYVASGRLEGEIVELALSFYNAGSGKTLAAGGVPNNGETPAYIERIKTLMASYMAGGSLTPAGGSPLAWALAQVGRPYRNSGPGDKGLDCCTLVYQAFQNTLGISLPMSTPGAPWRDAKCENAMMTRALEYGGAQIITDSAGTGLLPGDIIFFQSKSVSAAVDNVTHVGMWVGDGQLVDAAPGGGVQVRHLSYYRNSETLLPLAVRVPGAAG